MTKLLNKFLIVLSAIIFFSGLYLYFSDSLKSEAVVSSSGSLSSGNVTPTVVSSKKEKIAEQTAFINTLLSLNVIKIDTSLFSNKAFSMLKDNSVKIELDPNSVGRPNPFLLTGTETITQTTTTVETPKIVTVEPTSITEKSVVLNGRVNESTPSSVYFEYGLSEDKLDKKTSSAKLSLIGDFNTSVTGLKTKTTYFTRAVSKINTEFIYGEIISFTTN
jgi:hypothetical protein